MRIPIPRRLELFAYFCLLLAGCHGGGGGGGSTAPPPAPPAPPPATQFSVGGTVSGLDPAGGLVLQNSGGPDLAISANGVFSFPAQVATGAAYSVTIKNQPILGICSLTNASGTVASSAITNVAITCALRVFKFLYVPNGASDELRGFSINAATGSLAPVAWPPLVTDPGPSVLVADPAGKFVYLVTTGRGIDPPRISVYAADNATAALSEIQASPYDLSQPPPAPGIFILTAASIHPAGTFGYLSLIRLNATTTTTYGAMINAATGELTQIPGTPLDLGFAASGWTYDSTGGFLFVPTNSATGAGEIRSFSVDVPSGVLTPIGAFPTSGNTAFGAFLAPSGNHLLTMNLNSGTLMVFSRTGGTLTPLTSPPMPTGPAGSRPAGIQLNRRNNVFYTTNFPPIVVPPPPPAPPGPTTVAAFTFDPATGGVTPVGAPVTTNGAGSAALLHVSGRFLFQYNSTTSSIQRYALDAATGAPTLLPDVTPVPGAPMGLSMLLDPSGKFLYVTNTAAATISSYSIDATTGALTLINALPTGGAFSMAPFLLQ